MTQQFYHWLSALLTTQQSVVLPTLAGDVAGLEAKQYFVQPPDYEKARLLSQYQRDIAAHAQKAMGELTAHNKATNTVDSKSRTVGARLRSFIQRPAKFLSR